MRLRWLILLAAVLSLGAGTCGTNLPPITIDCGNLLPCPEGSTCATIAGKHVCVVTTPPLDCRQTGCPAGKLCRDQGGQWGWMCEQEPSPSPGPVPSPSFSPTPIPTPAPSPSVVPSPVPSAAPSPSPCVPTSAIPSEPVPSVGAGGNPRGAESSCGDHCTLVMPWGEYNCTSPKAAFPNGIRPHGAEPPPWDVKMLPDGSGGYIHDQGRGVYDFYGRLYPEGAWPPHGAPSHDWTDGYTGLCPPVQAVAVPCPVITPPPVPSPTPGPTPSASPPPSGTNLPVPPDGTCPPAFDHAPVRVGVGSVPAGPNRVNGHRSIYMISFTSHDVMPYCGHRGPTAAACDQLFSCGVLQDHRGEPPLIWTARYPGRDTCPWNDHDCAVEHPSRPCDAVEEAEDAANGLPPNGCRRPNSWEARMVIDANGENGGPPGIITVCAAPHARPDQAECSTWDFQLNGATPSSGSGRQATKKPPKPKPRKDGKPRYADKVVVHPVVHVPASSVQPVCVQQPKGESWHCVHVEPRAGGCCTYWAKAEKK